MKIDLKNKHLKKNLPYLAIILVVIVAVVFLTAKFLKKGLKITEVPIITKPTNYEEGKKIGVLDGFNAIWTIFKYRFIN